MIVKSLLAEIDRGREGKSQGFSIGLPKLEEYVDGVTKGTYTLIFAESGVGKSSFTLYSYIYRPIMEHLDDGLFKISLFSLEMSAEKLFAKLLSTYIWEHYKVRLSVKQIFSSQKGFILNDKNYEIIKKCVPWLEKVEKILTIYDKNANADSIYSNILTELENRGKFEDVGHRKVYHPDNPDLIHQVIIDHLARVVPTKGRTLKEEIDLTSKRLYGLKNRCGISPTVIMQSNRNIQSMDRRKQNMVVPMSSDIKDSNSPYEDSEVCMAIFSPNKAKLATHNKYDIKSMADNYRSVFVLKTRYGTADIEDAIYYDGKCNVWKELPRTDEIYDFEMFKNPDWYNQSKDSPIKADKEVSNLNFTL